MGLANLSAALSLDEMLSGLEKAAPSGGQMGRAPSVADGSERGGRAPSSRGGQSMMSRRSVGTRQSTGRMSTRASSCGSRVRSVIDDNIRMQARKEAHSYGHGHPSGAASEAARRARATAGGRSRLFRTRLDVVHQARLVRLGRRDDGDDLDAGQAERLVRDEVERLLQVVVGDLPASCEVLPLKLIHILG